MSLKRDTLYNILGSIAPMLIGVVTVPIYLRLVGDARYGVLALVWLFLGYFGIFDPGISRAASFHISKLHLDEQASERESVFWTALLVNLLFGLLGGLVVYAVARPLFMHTFKMPDSMREEVISSLPWLAASVPVSIVTGVFGGALQARECFGMSNSMNIFAAALSTLVPLAVAKLHGPDLKWLIPAVLITRMLAAIPNMYLLIREMPLFVGGRYDRKMVKPLFSYGGWITLTNLLGPLLTTMDRMLIGSIVSAQAVAFYSVPFNLVTRASIIPGAVASSLFPKLLKTGSEEDLSKLASRALLALASIMTPIVVLGIAGLPIFMRLWVGKAFAQNASTVGVILLVGVWINGLAYIPFDTLQASERPDLVAKFHAIEVIPFLGILWLGLHYFGLIGAACAWTLRVAADALLLFAFGGKVFGWRRLIPGAVLVALSTLFSPTIFLTWKTGVEFLIFIAALASSWHVSPSVRTAVRARFGLTHPGVTPVND